MIISYAQNFEDVLLWRALGHIEKGFYIDIGAQDPVIDSVSLAFYEKGWRGVHVEPTPAYAQALRTARPDETVLQVAIGSDASLIPIFEIAQTGLSTGDERIAKRHAATRGFVSHTLDAPCISLSALLDHYGKSDVHWLKIDVEGMEESVLRSWAPSPVRPWILVVESTLPLTQEQSHSDWEEIVTGLGYVFAYFDGLNRFYVLEEHSNLVVKLATPPNVFDGFVLADSQPFCTKLNKALTESRAQVLQLHGRQADLEERLRITQLEVEALRSEAALATKFSAELTALHSELLKAQQVSAVTESHLRDELRRECKINAAFLDLQRRASDERVAFSQREGDRLHAERMLSMQLGQAQGELARLRSSFLWRLRGAFRKSGEYSGSAAKSSSFDATTRCISATKASECNAPAARAHSSSASPMDIAVSPDSSAATASLETLLGYDDERFVHCAYRLLLGREADAEGLNNYVAEVRSGVPKQQIVMELALSPEGTSRMTDVPGLGNLLATLKRRQNSVTARLWRKILGKARSPSERQLRVLVNRFKKPDQHFRSNALPQSRTPQPDPPSSETFQQAIGLPVVVVESASFLPPGRLEQASTTKSQKVEAATTVEMLLALHDQQFVQCAYRTLLGRPADVAGLENYLGEMRNGVSKPQIVVELSSSAEGRQRTHRLPGLDSFIEGHARRRSSLMSRLLKRLGGTSAESIEQQFRAADFRLREFSNATQFRLNQLDAIAAQLTKAAPFGLPLSDEEREQFGRMSVNGRSIFFQLRDAVAKKARLEL